MNGITRAFGKLLVLMEIVCVIILRFVSNLTMSVLNTASISNLQVASFLYHQEKMNVLVEPDVHDIFARIPGFGFVQTFYNQDTRYVEFVNLCEIT